MGKLQLLRIVLHLGAIYYVIGAFAHYFGITLFPWYDERLYTPYHDSVIALVAVILAYLLFVVAKDPVKNIDILKVVIVSAFLGSVFSIAINWKVDFAALGTSEKGIQTVVEGILGFIWVAVLLLLYPKRSKH